MNGGCSDNSAVAIKSWVSVLCGQGSGVWGLGLLGLRDLTVLSGLNGVGYTLKGSSVLKYSTNSRSRTKDIAVNASKKKHYRPPPDGASRQTGRPH